MMTRRASLECLASQSSSVALALYISENSAS